MKPVRPFERFLAILGALACLVITIAVWRAVGSAQPMWPLPALYLIELVVVAVFAALVFILGASFGTLMLWTAFGILLAFALLGAFSVGFTYLPVVLLFAIVSISSVMRHRSSLAAGFGVFLIAGLVQAALMLGVAGLLVVR